MKLSHPLPGGKPTDRFGPRGVVAGIGDLGFHTGQDWAAPQETPILAAHDGVVTRQWFDRYKDGTPAGGNMIEIRGDEGIHTRYAHMLHRSPLAIGQRVTAGQVIGQVGATGAATGPHLHFEVIVRGTAIDPLPLIDATPPLEEIPMPALIRHPNGDIGFVSDAGELDKISSMTEVQALQATGIVKGWVNLPDPLIWNTLAARTKRLRAASIGKTSTAK